MDTLKKTVDALKENYLAIDSELFIFSDAAKDEMDVFSINEVREYIKNIRGFRKISIYESKKNKGLANSIIEGVSNVLKNYDSVIVLEDDLVSSRNFLNYMNDSLNRFQNESSVFSISGFSFDLKLKDKIESDSYFLNRGWSWGWATWKDRWEEIDWDVKDYNTFIQSKVERKKFAKGGTDLNSMLDNQMAGKLDSWAIRWFYSQFKLNGLTLYPVKSKIYNIGFGINATHTTGSSKRYIPIFDIDNNRVFKYPEALEIKVKVLKRFQAKMGYLSRIRSKIETFLGL